jgi:heme/copper-type cytochrome/quinol oxidase subunit 3
MTGHSHTFHLVDPSPWPFVGSIAAFTATMGGALYMHSFALGNLLLPFGIFLIMYTMFYWWRDVVREGTYEGHHTAIVQLGLRYGMLLFIVSEIMFFFAFFWAFFDASMAPTIEIGSIWPPMGIDVLNPFEVPLLNTAILLTSGATVTWAHHAIVAGERRETIIGLLLTILLGVVFTLLQAFEYADASFNISDGVYGTTFYLATGFHGFHVLIGTIFLTVCLYREIEYHFTREHHFGFEAAAWYWHFVDVVWLFLFISIYWWGGLVV